MSIDAGRALIAVAIVTDRLALLLEAPDPFLSSL